MRRATTFLGLALLTIGCGGGKDAKPSVEASGKRPPADEAKACIVAYLNQCGWQNVELVQMADQPQLPDGAQVTGDAWAYGFTANYTNVFGERLTTTNWVAVIG